jgi:hypothetical protein
MNHANQLLINYERQKKYWGDIHRAQDDIRLINERILIAVSVSVNPNLKNPKWCIAGFMIKLVQITSTA